MDTDSKSFSGGSQQESTSFVVNQQSGWRGGGRAVDVDVSGMGLR